MSSGKYMVEFVDSLGMPIARQLFSHETIVQLREARVVRIALPVKYSFSKTRLLREDASISDVPIPIITVEFIGSQYDKTVVKLIEGDKRLLVEAWGV